MIARRYRLLVAAVVAIAAVVFLSMAIVIASQAPLPPPEDLIIGTWRLNVAKSKYSPGPPPKSETRTYERGPGGLKATIKRVYADGMVESLEYLANLDSVNPVTGSNAYDTVRMKRINEYRVGSSPRPCKRHLRRRDTDGVQRRQDDDYFVPQGITGARLQPRCLREADTITIGVFGVLFPPLLSDEESEHSRASVLLHRLSNPDSLTTERHSPFDVGGGIADCVRRFGGRQRVQTQSPDRRRKRPRVFPIPNDRANLAGELALGLQLLEDGEERRPHRRRRIDIRRCPEDQDVRREDIGLSGRDILSVHPSERFDGLGKALQRFIEIGIWHPPHANAGPRLHRSDGGGGRQLLGRAAAAIERDDGDSLGHGSGEIEQQDFAAIATARYLQLRLFAHGGAVALLQQLSVERHLAANDLHPGMPRRCERLLHGLPGARSDT